MAEAKGRLDEQVERAIGWFRGLGRFESYRGLIREDRGLLPESALREALVNAVVHRDYKGFMEKRGRGWPVMRTAMREFNDTEPEILHEDGGGFVRVTFHLDSPEDAPSRLPS